MRINKNETLGLIIDIQEKLLPAMVEKESLLKNTKNLIKGLKELQVPVLSTEQYPKGLGNTVDEIKEILDDSRGEEKMAFSCCHNKEFSEMLKQYQRNHVIIAGIEAHVCVLQTVTDLLMAGFIPVVIEDCISSRKINDKVIALERMKKEGAIISTTESILFELTRTAEDPAFKAISKIIK